MLIVELLIVEWRRGIGGAEPKGEHDGPYAAFL